MRVCRWLLCFEAGEDLNFRKCRYEGPSERERLKIQGLAPGSCSVNAEGFLKYMSRGRVLQAPSLDSVAPH